MTTACLILSMLLAIDQRPQIIQSPLESKARDFITNFNNARFDEAAKDFSRTLQGTATPAVLADLKHQSDVYLGGFRVITSVQQRTEGGLRVLHLLCNYEKSAAAFRVAFDAEAHIGAIYLDPIVNEPVDPILEVTARQFLKSLIAGDLDAAARHFDKNLRGQLPPFRLSLLKTQIIDAYGAFRSVTSVHQISDESHRTIDLTAAFERSSVSVRVAFDSDRQVTGIKLAPVPATP